MRKPTRPAVDSMIAPAHGVTREGQPLSYNRAPAADLAPWVARLYATVVEAPPGHRTACGLFNDVATIRVQLKGEWTAETAEGPRAHGRAALFFGPQSRRMPVSVTGSFISIGIALRPGTGHAVRGVSADDYLDRLLLCDELRLPGEQALRLIDDAAEPETWLTQLEALIRRVVNEPGVQRPDPVSARFEALAFTDPAASVAEFARDCGITQRQLERIVRRDFGMPPKQVLRRARALDMASHLRGVADQAEAEELALRYYDQSHLIREFTALFGMSPTQFIARPQPILTLTLESRQARRLELTKRLLPGEPRPWE
ncbi:helix-turn-helix domain-containing protein [Novosphingobium piscinae]|uniref:Helix-turn-helix transcriptional regulator n=1 Tax=Novosphingobium piscinae TaxID=1507448 RepID=A0A7X1KRI1_9SPHN|nr:AraC family transcriptional regulator [Novosphingobium piscinae]MBC2670859.1 helix-turn-helix transcriptional regulator [Novosphingobium piscinae]